MRALYGATNSRVVRRREHADPRVEELDHVGARVDLLAHVAREARPRASPSARATRRGSRYMNAFTFAKSRLGLPFDQVARDGERRAAEADDGLLVVELAAHDPDRLAHLRRDLVGDVQLLRRRTTSTTGPTPSTSFTSTPIATTGVMMSANITAASTPWRRTGCSVTSAQSSGVRPSSKKSCRSRSARYSGSERPAWRMNHTGVRSTGSHLAARTSRGSVTARRRSGRRGA